MARMKLQGESSDEATQWARVCSWMAVVFMPKGWDLAYMKKKHSRFEWTDDPCGW